MNKPNYILLLAAAGLCACSQMEPLTPETGEGRLTARIEGAAPDTKTSYDSGIRDPRVGDLVWNEGDQVAIHFSDGSYQNVAVENIGGTVNDPAVCEFRAPSTAARYRDCYAVYPASAADPANYGNPTLKLTLPDSYDISDIVAGTGTRTADFSPCPLVAYNDEGSSLLDFYHVGGLLRMTLLSIYPDAARVRVVFPTDITGAYAVTDPGTQTPVITTAGNASANSVLFTLAGGAAIGQSKSVVLNVPLPCGVYNGFKVEALNAQGASLGEVSINYNLTVIRHHGKKFWLIFPHTLSVEGEGLYWTDNLNEGEDIFWNNYLNQGENLNWK